MRFNLDALSTFELLPFFLLVKALSLHLMRAEAGR